MDQGTFWRLGVNFVSAGMLLVPSVNLAPKFKRDDHRKSPSQRLLKCFCQIYILMSKWIAADSLPVIILINLRLSSARYLCVEGKRRKAENEGCGVFRKGKGKGKVAEAMTGGRWAFFPPLRLRPQGVHLGKEFPVAFLSMKVITSRCFLWQSYHRLSHDILSETSRKHET